MSRECTYQGSFCGDTGCSVHGLRGIDADLAGLQEAEAMTDPTPVWAPIVPKPEPLWLSPLEMAEAYRRAEPRVNYSQRHELVVTEPKKEGRDHDG